MYIVLYINSWFLRLKCMKFIKKSLYTWIIQECTKFNVKLDITY